jgi:hypothetical protein
MQLMAYSAMAVTPQPKIFFTWAPGGRAFYGMTGVSSKFQYVMVWTAYMVSSTYGPFTLVYIDYEYQVGTVWHYVDYWYTTNLAAGQAYAHLTVRSYTDATDVYDSYVVTLATIVTNQPSSNPYYLSVAVTASGTSISIQYWAAPATKLESELVTGAVSPTLFVGSKSTYALSNAVVTGIPHAGFLGGGFILEQNEIYDPSLLS